MKVYFNRGQGGAVRGQEEGGEGTRRDRVKGRLYKEYILHERARRMNNGCFKLDQPGFTVWLSHSQAG